MLRIAHTADVHWRGLSRHDEYRVVFESFIADCKKNDVDHIFIGGDIFHTKTSGISPEYIEQMTWWLDAMSKVSVVHLILGNHDGNLINPSRQDAVSPIIDAMKNDRIKLYKKSGIYEFAPGYNWCVFSLFDKEGWKDVKPEPGMTNIACFHGAVAGSITETGWDVTEGFTPERFKEYDFAFLGDIHKRQMLGYRDNKPWIGYPGTPVQQNYAEQLDHGYLLWEISSSLQWDVKFRELPNPKPYVTVEWEGSNEDFFKKALKYPLNSRFRVKTQIPMSQHDVHVVTEFLKNNCHATETTFKSDIKVENSTIKSGDNSIAKNDIRSQEVVMSLLQDYGKKNKYTTLDWKSIEAEVSKYLSSVNISDDSVRNVKWSIKHLKWDNVFSYGEENEIYFDRLSGIVGIFGSNRIGKSSIVGTLMYSLYNTTDRGSLKNIHVCNVRKNYCSARTVLELAGTTYVVERQTSKSYNKKGQVNASTALNLYRMNDEELEDLCGEQRTDTEKTLRSLIGTSDDFLTTSFSAQGETNAFLSLSSSKRRTLLSRFLDLDVFDRMFELANKDLNGYKGRLKAYPDRDWDSILENNKISCETLQDEINHLADKITIAQGEESDLRRQISNSSGLKIVTKSEVDAQLRTVDNLTKQSEECSVRIKNLEVEVASLEGKLNIIREILDAEDINDLKKKMSSIESIEKSMLELRRMHEKEELELKRQQKSVALLQEVPCNDEYPTCKFIKNAHVDKKSLKSQLERESSVKKSFDDVKKSLEAFDKEEIAAKITKHEKAASLNSSVQLEISKKETEIEKYKKSCEALVENTLVARQKLESLEKALKNSENYEIVNTKSKLESLSSDIKTWDDMKLQAAKQYGKLISDSQKLSEERRERLSLLKEMEALEFLCEAFSKKGLPLTITKSQLPIINAEIARILHGIVDFTVELENEEETDSTEIYINYGDSKRLIELCSGMEKTIGSIALRVALANISSLPKSDMFIVDEGFGTLDEAGVEACNRLLISLKKHFRIILVITHVDEIKDAADTLIEITKIEKDSKVCHT